MGTQSTDTTVTPYALPPRQAAEYIGVQPKTLRTWRSEGRGPAYRRLGPRTYVYRVTDLQTFVEETHEQSMKEQAV